MTEMVESLAMALRERHRKVGVNAWAEMSEKNQQYWRDEARAVLGYLREPTTAMLNAACAAMSPGKRPTPQRVSAKSKHGIRYRAMIDAALREDKP